MEQKLNQSSVVQRLVISWRINLNKTSKAHIWLTAVRCQHAIGHILPDDTHQPQTITDGTTSSSFQLPLAANKDRRGGGGRSLLQERDAVKGALMLRGQRRDFPCWFISVVRWQEGGGQRGEAHTNVLPCGVDATPRASWIITLCQDAMKIVFRTVKLSFSTADSEDWTFLIKKKSRNVKIKLIKKPYKSVI